MNLLIRFLHIPAIGVERVNYLGEDQGCRLYVIPESSIETGIKLLMNDRTVATSRHLAVDSNGVAHIIDDVSKQRFGSLGPCEIIQAD